MSQPFPFSAIVGQAAMKQAMVLTAIDPGIGGVLVFGDRGTGKSTAVRALAARLPEITAVEGCPVNSARLEDVPGWRMCPTGLARNPANWSSAPAPSSTCCLRRPKTASWVHWTSNAPRVPHKSPAL